MSGAEEHPSTTAEGIATEGTPRPSLDGMAPPRLPEPEAHGATREHEPGEDDEHKAKQARTWMDSPSRAVISDCLMAWAEDKSLLSPEEILGLNNGAFVATRNMESLHAHTQDVIHLKSVCSCGAFENTNMYQHTMLYLSTQENFNCCHVVYTRKNLCNITLFHALCFFCIDPCCHVSRLKLSCFFQDGNQGLQAFV